MKKIYFTLTGTCFYHGGEFMEPGMQVKLVKEPDNPYDSEAIKVKMKGIGQVGYVANSPKTVLGESMSAGRIYDRIGKKAAGRVVQVLPGGVLCKLDKKSLLGEGDKKKTAEDAASEMSKERFFDE